MAHFNLRNPQWHREQLRKVSWFAVGFLAAFSVAVALAVVDDPIPLGFKIAFVLFGVFPLWLLFLAALFELYTGKSFSDIRSIFLGNFAAKLSLIVLAILFFEAVRLLNWMDL